MAKDHEFWPLLTGKVFVPYFVIFLDRSSFVRVLRPTILETSRSPRKFSDGPELRDVGIYSRQACFLNSNIEIRNNFKMRNIKIRNSSPQRICLKHWVFGHLTLFRASNFVLRIYRFPWRPLRSFDFAQDRLCAIDIPTFGYGYPALGPSWRKINKTSLYP